MFLEQNAENSLLQSRSVAGAVNWIESSDKFLVVTRHAQDWRRQKVWMKKESWPIELRSSKNKEWREPALMAKKRMFVLRKKPSIYPSIHRRSFSASHLKRLALFWSCLELFKLIESQQNDHFRHSLSGNRYFHGRYPPNGSHKRLYCSSIVEFFFDLANNQLRDGLSSRRWFFE